LEFKKHQLENGLTIIAECNENAYSTALGFFVNAGSRDETDAIGGVSHFLEHMAFKGTPKRSAEDVNRELDEMGSYSNARTSEERTIYHATVLPEFQNSVVELLCDIMRPSLREEDFETEKQVIIEEIRMYDDQPPFGGHERIMAQFFGGHPLGRSVLGTVETVGDLTPEQMRDYFQQRYSPGNMLLVAAGNVDFDELVRVAEEQCGDWEPADVDRKKIATQPQSGFEISTKDSSAQQYILQLANGPVADSDERYANRVLSAIVGDDSGSRLFWEFIDTGRAEYAGMGAYEYYGAGVVMSVLCCDPELAQENLQRLFDLQHSVCVDGIKEAELELAKRKIGSHIVLQSERPENRMFVLGANWLQREVYQTTRDVVEGYQAVTMERIEQVISQFPLTTNYTLAVGPLTQLEPPKISTVA